MEGYTEQVRGDTGKRLEGIQGKGWRVNRGYREKVARI